MTKAKLKILTQTPAALGFNAAHARQSLRHAVAETVAMRHLIKPVRSSHRTDPNRFEEYVVGVTHGMVPYQRLRKAGFIQIAR